MLSATRPSDPNDPVAVALLMAERIVSGTDKAYDDATAAITQPNSRPKLSDYAVHRAKLINKVAAELLAGLVTAPSTPPT